MIALNPYRRVELVEFHVVAADQHDPEDGADERHDLGHRDAPPQRPHPEGLDVLGGDGPHPDERVRRDQEIPDSAVGVENGLHHTADVSGERRPSGQSECRTSGQRSLAAPDAPEDHRHRRVVVETGEVAAQVVADVEER